MHRFRSSCNGGGEGNESHSEIVQSVFIISAHGKMAPIYAIRLDAAGDISLKENDTSNQYVAWSTPKQGAYMITPLAYGDYLYNCKNNGVASCYEAKTGNRIYQEGLGSGTRGFTATPVAGDGIIYLSCEDGDFYVIKAGPTFKVISKNAAGDIFMATPAISEGVPYFRTKTQILAISIKVLTLGFRESAGGICVH